MKIFESCFNILISFQLNYIMDILKRKLKGYFKFIDSVSMFYRVFCQLIIPYLIKLLDIYEWHKRFRRQEAKIKLII